MRKSHRHKPGMPRTTNGQVKTIPQMEANHRNSRGETARRRSALRGETAGSPEQGQPPGTPRLLRFSDVSGNRVKIAWDPPIHDGGGPVTGYEYAVAVPRESEPAVNSPLVWNEGTPTAETWARVGGLDADGRRHFRVRAVNRTGRGAWSREIQGALRPSGGGRVVVSPTNLNLQPGGAATYTVRLASGPTRPLYVVAEWEEDELAGQLAPERFGMILPDGWTHPTGREGGDPTHGWRGGVPITVRASQDNGGGDGSAVIHHFVYTVPALDLGSPEGWTRDPVYDLLAGASVRVIRQKDT